MLAPLHLNVSTAASEAPYEETKRKSTVEAIAYTVVARSRGRREESEPFVATCSH